MYLSLFSYFGELAERLTLFLALAILLNIFPVNNVITMN